MMKYFLVYVFFIFSCTSSIAQSMAKAVDIASASTVQIWAKMDEKKPAFIIGTGWLYKDQHTVITAKHVSVILTQGEIESGKLIKALSFTVRFADGKTAKVIADQCRESENYDIAAMQIDIKDVADAKRPVLKLSDKSPRIGDMVVGVGNPLQIENIAFIGWITGKNKVSSDTYTNANIAPGHSGSAALNQNGEVIGLAYARHLEENSIVYLVSWEALKLELPLLTH